MRLLEIALKSLLQHRRRTFVLGFCIAAVTFMMVALLGLAEGMNRSLIETSTTLSSGHVNVAGFYKFTAGQAAPLVTKYKGVAEVVRKEVPELDYIALRGRGWAKVISDTNSKMFGLTGVDISAEQGLKQMLVLKEGSLDGLSSDHAIALFENQARELEVKIGDQVTLSAPTPRGTSNTVDVTVVAIVQDMGMMSQFSSFVNNVTIQHLYQLNDETAGALQLYLKRHDPQTLKTVQEKLRSALKTAGYELMDEDPRAFFFKFENVSREAWTGQKLDITNWRDEVSFVSWTVDLVNALAFLFASVLMAIVGVGIMIVMWIAIRERTREIGTLRAIGMQKTRVLAMFLLEGFMLGLISTVLGAVSGVVFSVLVNAAHVHVPEGVQIIVLSDTLNLVPTAQWTLTAIIYLTTVVTVLSLLPSFLAARLKPVTAMSHVG